jgi:cell wall-associated NlpC family hydrolase
MTDRRVTPDPAIAKIETNKGQIGWAHVDLLARPAGPRDRQLLLGEAVTILGAQHDHSYVRAEKDGYLGFVDTRSLTAPATATHQVTAAATHAYDAASIKSADRAALSFGARITATADSADFVETALGHIPKAALTPCPVPALDPVTTARRFIDTPYLWGGNTRAGLDCSGLVQAALLAAHIVCPGDSDLQERHVGTMVHDGIWQRGDLLFWKGHVALITSASEMIHANAHYMAVTEEPITAAIARIKTSGGGPVTSYKRL